MKTFYNGKKIPLIPSLLINDKLQSDFGKKANHFNEFFVPTPLNNRSTLPHSLSNTPTVELAPGFDDISIHMIKICDQSTVKPLSIIYQNCLNKGAFLDIWKKSNIVSVHTKGGKQVVNNYRPVSLLPVYGKILERLVFNSIFDALDNNSSLVSANKSGFRHSDSCESQRMSICHKLMPLLIFIQLLRLGVYF